MTFHDKKYLLPAILVSSSNGECGWKCYIASIIVVLNLLNPFKHKINLNNMQGFSSYISKHTASLLEKANWLMLGARIAQSV
jgi:hypothetical protein